MLLVTRNKQTHPALTSASKSGTQFTIPWGIEGRVYLGELVVRVTCVCLSVCYSGLIGC